MRHITIPLPLAATAWASPYERQGRQQSVLNRAQSITYDGLLYLHHGRWSPSDGNTRRALDPYLLLGFHMLPINMSHVCSNPDTCMVGVKNVKDRSLAKY